MTTKMVLYQECQVDLSFKNLINVIHNIQKVKEKYHMIGSTEWERAFEKIQYVFVIKLSKQKPCSYWEQDKDIGS